MLLDKVKRLFADESVIVRECRRCGTSLSSDDDICPECGSTESAQFEIS